MKTLNRHTTVP